MKNIAYTLMPVSEEFTGSAKVWRAIVQTNGTIDAEQLAKVLAEKTKQDESLAVYFLKALNEILEDKITAGYRVNLGELATGFAIKGSFLSEDDAWDAARHSLVPTIRTCEPLKSALAAVEPENLQQCLTCSIYSLMDFVTKETNCITGTHEVHVQGVNLGIDTENADEGVTLVDEDGVVKATATVTASDAQVIDCSFPTPPAAGVYTLVVACRNGNRVTLAPAVGRLAKVVVKAA